MNPRGVAQTESNGYRVRIEQDIQPPNPRNWGEPIGTIVEWHSSYDIGEEKIERSVYDNKYEALKHHLSEPVEDYIVLPVYMLDHSMIRLNTIGFHSRWDSAQVGWIYVHENRAQEIFGEDVSDEKVRKFLKDEIEKLDQWNMGDVYCFGIYEIDNCSECGHTEYINPDTMCGFYGRDFGENGLLTELRRMLGIHTDKVDEIVEDLIEEEL